jgi:hypothetical protein
MFKTMLQTTSEGCEIILYRSFGAAFLGARGCIDRTLEEGFFRRRGDPTAVPEHQRNPHSAWGEQNAYLADAAPHSVNSVGEFVFRR